MNTPHPAPAVTGVLLAAGAGTRLRRGPKALLEFDGRQWAAHLSTEMLIGGCSEVLVVAGAGADALRATDLADGVRVVLNPGWESGLSTSFRLGVAEAAAGTDILVALVDQPGLHRGVVRRLTQARRAGSIENPSAGARAAMTATYPAPDGSARRGHPILFTAGAAQAAADLAVGDAGARAWLSRNPGRVHPVDCSDLDSGDDVDTPADLEAWLRTRWTSAQPGDNAEAH